MGEKKRVLVALSGGVDSSVAVHLLRQEGYEVFCAVLLLSQAHEPAVAAARSAAEALSVPLSVVDGREAFREQVILPFVQAYQEGRTPNPCIVCNPKIKFRFIMEEADRLGCAYIATGHYAAVAREDGRYFLQKAVCRPRDQSYMLYRLTQGQLSRLLLPLQALSKDQVREIAASLSLPCASQPDSQEICFIPDGDYGGFVEGLGGKADAGDFIAPDGSVCGRHKGIIHYTVGQRRGLGIAMGRHVYVKEICPRTRQVRLGEREDLLLSRVRITDVCRPGGLIPEEGIFSVSVKVRSMAREAPAAVTLYGDGTGLVAFDEPQWAPAKGQSAVFYQGDRVAGGGFILSAE